MQTHDLVCRLSSVTDKFNWGVRHPLSLSSFNYLPNFIWQQGQDLVFCLYCSPPLIWHFFWLHKKVLYHRNVVLRIIIWPFGCHGRTIEDFEVNGLFQCKVSSCMNYNENRYESLAFLFDKYAHNVTIYIYFYNDVFIISHTTKERIYCLLMMFVDIEFIHERLHIHDVYNLKLWWKLLCKIW